MKAIQTFILTCVAAVVILSLVAFIRHRRRLKRERMALLAKRREAAGLLSLACALAFSAAGQEVTVPATMPPDLRDAYHRDPVVDFSRPDDEIPQLEARLREYSRAHWSELMNGWRSGTPNDREVYWVTAGAEYLPGRDYILFLDRLMREVEAGRLPLLATGKAFSGTGSLALTPGKSGFVQSNLQHPDIRNLLKRQLAILDRKTPSAQTWNERKWRWGISQDLSLMGDGTVISPGEPIEKLDKKLVQLPPLPPVIENIDLNAFLSEFNPVNKVRPRPPSMGGTGAKPPPSPDATDLTRTRRLPDDEPSLALPIAITLLSGIAVLILFIRAVRRLA